MNPFLKKLLLGALLFEVILFFMLYYFGPNGYHLFSGLIQQKIVLYEQIKKIQSDIDTLEQKIRISQTAFAKERVARERLFMKKDDEIVYFKK